MSARSPAAQFRSSQKRTGPTFVEAIGRMKTGEVLRFAFDQTRPAWSLGNETISSEVITLLISCRDVEPDSDTLFDGAPAQTWRLRKA
jgi:hypothetical protein